MDLVYHPTYHLHVWLKLIFIYLFIHFLIINSNYYFKHSLNFNLIHLISYIYILIILSYLFLYCFPIHHSFILFHPFLYLLFIIIIHSLNNSFIFPHFYSFIISFILLKYLNSLLFLLLYSQFPLFLIIIIILINFHL